MIGKVLMRVYEFQTAYFELFSSRDRFGSFSIETLTSVLYDEFGVDCDLVDKLFYFFNRQSLLLAGKQDIKLYSILAGIILFAPDRGLSKLSYRELKA